MGRTSDEHWVKLWESLSAEKEIGMLCKWQTMTASPENADLDTLAAFGRDMGQMMSARRRAIAAHKRICEQRDRDSANYDGSWTP